MSETNSGVENASALVDLILLFGCAGLANEGRKCRYAYEKCITDKQNTATRRNVILTIHFNVVGYIR